ncbi:plant UBX domain-containing protein 8-like isoform X2 [Punica granatum]|uniref:Plant UBX domain-containing protein 8-like isoform X2 n=1 Tax=Punica granatum TaxID=22663 RepID=A0A218XS53_PUNGR|nr:plant UBX domain-containing protein 8-like isoform X2 [Punica granatum]OWM87783.1 hypothetical protein CDL15_Pgr016479 [Punica granatum]
MARPDQDEVLTFMSITGLPESAALQKLEEHNGNLNEALNAHFSEGDRNQVSARPAPPDDFMDIDDQVQAEPRDPPLSLHSAAGDSLNPIYLESLTKRYFDEVSNFGNHAPFVSHPREVREIPIEVKDGSGASGNSGHGPVIEDVTGSDNDHGPSVRGTVIVDEEDDDIPPISTAHVAQSNEREEISFQDGNVRPSAPVYDNSSDFNYVEEEMIRAAIEASKRDIEGSPRANSEFRDPGIQRRPSRLEDAELVQAVSLSLKENASCERASDSGSLKVAEVELGKAPSSNGRLEMGGSSTQDEVEEIEQPLIRHRSRRSSSRAVEPLQEIEGSPPSPGQNDANNHPQNNGNVFPTDEWGGISSEEHDEAVMLEAAMFGGIPEGTGYNFAYAPHQFMQAQGRYPRPAPRPPSPSLEAQRLIREQQDDEYLAALQADREKELKAKAEAEARRVEEEAAKRAALEEERRKEEEARRRLEEEQEFERQLAAKEASLPQEPSSSDENAITLLVRMPDGSRRGRRFLKSDKLESLFDFIDIGRAVKPGTYRVVRPYPRRAFSDGEGSLTLNDLGLASKQEALFLELI